MPKFFLLLNNSKIKKITTYLNPYHVGFISLSFENTLEAELAYNELGKLDLPIMRIGNELACMGLNHSDLIASHCVSYGLVHDNDRPDLAQLLKQSQITIEQQQNQAPSMNTPQKDTLQSVAEIYIEDVIDNCTDYTTAIKLLRCAFYEDFQKIVESAKILLTEKKIEANVIGSVISLWKICHGEANMETTYLRMGKNVPNLLAQRNFLHSICINKLKDKFASLDDVHQLYMILGLLIFKVKGQRLNPLDDSSQIISRALCEHQESPWTNNIFSVKDGHPNFMVLVTEAFKAMGILYIDKWPDISRIEKLQQHFKSVCLINYLASLEEQKKKIAADKNNSLLPALIANDSFKAADALGNGEDVNQYFNDGRTPLIVAVQDCDEKMVALILKFKPEVNKSNSYNTGTAILFAIRQSNIKKLNLLLEADANLFLHCGGIFIQSPFVGQPSKMVLACPLEIAVDQYKKNKNELSKNVIQLLLKHGAGIGINLDILPTEILEDGMVVIGATTTKNTPDIKLFKTSDDFKLNIKPCDYQHWHKIIKQACFAYPKNSSVVSELKLILSHIEKSLSEKQNEKDKTVSVSNRMGSPITSAGDAHDSLLNEIKACGFDSTKIGSFIESINKHQYSQALRRACTSKDKSMGATLLKILLKYKDKLNINIDEKAGDDERAALHYAGIYKNEEAFDILIKAEANQNLPDIHGNTPEKYMESDPNTTLKQKHS